ncbi:hypothetical protein KSP40_PGU006576 [Platanthera guangdongensis]|uniref:Uncharacterized protein n=1 Tax=Platanthera guangdongensis TaxID=2320717 RepID=A0ABR2MS80_9ASPA
MRTLRFGHTDHYFQENGDPVPRPKKGPPLQDSGSDPRWQRPPPLPRLEGPSGRPLRGGRLTLRGGGGGGGCTTRPRQRWWSALAGMATAKAARCGLSGKDGCTTRRCGRGRTAVVGPIAAKAARGSLGGDGGRPAWGQPHGAASGPTLVGPAVAEAARCGLGGDGDRPMLGGRGHRRSLFTVR